MEISLGLLVLATLGILAYIAMQMGQLKGVVGQSLHAQVVFDDAAGLVSGAAVKIAGVQVGRVEGLAVDFDKARATLALDPGAQIRTDAVVSIRARSLLGEKYVQIDPRSRTAALLEDGGTLTAAPGGTDLDQVISQLGPMVKDLDVKDVGPLLAELKGLVSDNHEPVNKVVAQVNDLLARLEKVHFDDPAAQADVKALIRNLRKTSDALPGMIKQSDQVVNTVATRAGPLLDKVDRAFDKLEPALEKLPGTVDKVTLTLDHADKVLTVLEPLLVRASSMDYNLAKKLLREEGLLIRFKSEDVQWPSTGDGPRSELDGSSSGLDAAALPARASSPAPPANRSASRAMEAGVP